MRNSILADFISLFFPRYCYACREQLYSSEECICLNCEHGLLKTNYHLDDQNPVLIKMYGKAPVKFASAYLRFVKSGKTQRLLHQLKYHNKPEVGNILGKWYAKDLREVINDLEIQLVTPVPLHPKKMKKRGYNQSEEFAHGLAEVLQIEMNNALIECIKESSTQTKKSKLKRWQNVENIFRITNPKYVKGKHILVVDDVITTGSTLASCANELLKSEAESVSVLTIAVAEYT